MTSGAAVWLRTPDLELSVEPDRGGRITSLRDRRTEREWLQQPSAPPRAVSYGAPFTAGDLAGWDEMLPTIVPCPVPGSGAELPDHGELWAVPWELEHADGTSVRTAVQGRAVDYRLTRTIRLRSSAAVSLEYELELRAAASVPLLWAAHPQLVWEPGARIVIEPRPGEVHAVTEPGAPIVAWDEDLAAWLDHAPAGSGRKVWTGPAAAPERVGVVGPSGSIWLSWSSAELPYLGLWFDAGAVAAGRVLVPEPSNGFYDDLAHASARGLVPVFQPCERRTWRLDLALELPSHEDRQRGEMRVGERSGGER